MRDTIPRELFSNGSTVVKFLSNWEFSCPYECVIHNAFVCEHVILHCSVEIWYQKISHYFHFCSSENLDLDIIYNIKVIIFTNIYIFPYFH